METDISFLYDKISNFSSKEISFIKSDSDTLPNSVPEQYLCDFLFEEEKNNINNQLAVNFNSFTKEILEKFSKEKSSEENSINNSVIRDDDKNIVDAKEFTAVDNKEFTAVVIKFLCPVSSCNENHQMETLVHALNAAIQEKEGIWQQLSESVIIIAFWKVPEDVENILNDLMQFINVTLKLPFYAGGAYYPFMELTPDMVLCNAVKAVDHAAFFPTGKLIFFDDITQNIFADRLYQIGNIEEAAKEYEKGLLIKEDNLNIRNSLGVCYSLMNSLDLAKEQFEKAISIYESKECNLNNFDNITLNNIEELENIEKLESQKDDLNLINKNTKNTQQVQQDDLYINDNIFMLFYNAALTCNLIGDIEHGLVYIKKAISINSSLFETELTAAVLFIKAEYINDAEIHLKKALDINPKSSMARRLLGEIYLNTNQIAEAAKQYTSALKSNPYDPVSMSGLARAFEIQNKNLNIALDLALHSLTIAPDNPHFRGRLGKIYLKMGKYDSADIEFSKAEKQFKEAEIHLKEEKRKDKEKKHDISSLFKDSKEMDSEFSVIKTDDNEDIDTIFKYSCPKLEEFKKKSA